MTDQWRRIVFGAKLRLPKVFVRRFEAEIEIKAIAQNKDYFARLCHKNYATITLCR